MFTSGVRQNTKVAGFVWCDVRRYSTGLTYYTVVARNTNESIIHEIFTRCKQILRRHLVSTSDSDIVLRYTESDSYLAKTER